jgi:hypothetical protein
MPSQACTITHTALPQMRLVSLQLSSRVSSTTCKNLWRFLYLAEVLGGLYRPPLTFVISIVASAETTLESATISLPKKTQN